jgi:hypothetical protein
MLERSPANSASKKMGRLIMNHIKMNRGSEIIPPNNDIFVFLKKMWEKTNPVANGRKVNKAMKARIASTVGTLVVFSPLP